ncbi:V-type ATPase 116kDa subunit family protein [Streptomyces silvisoli]|uniref:V-type ATPase 116kDa subunit family protein n=1 Tax=Streptomyces silvisoli TaxID=3034235 RepID=A0ABT5ZW73_9ACTN|nr:V-type ATPase 116kDa subunit family protein [Streptomyces silvisoli]MDF3293288.1 V-type ATPase 116kDa subunit family protein [Streptomyces silvisoli]
MPWSEALTPVRMQRVAIIAPHTALREILVLIADAGCVEIDRIDGLGHGTRGAALRLRRLRSEPTGAALSAAVPDLAVLEREGHAELLAGEAQLEERADSAVVRGATAALAGWCPADQVPRLAERFVDVGGVLVPLETPRGVDPPTLLRATGAPGRSFTSLVTAYGTVPYRDVDPSWPAGIAYVVMFGVMFGDAGHGLLLLLAAALLYRRRPRCLASLHTMWPFVAGAGIASALAGVAYGEFFGPTGVLPVLWLDPVGQPQRLLVSAVAFGGLLLALAYTAGTVNRWREGGPSTALYATSGMAGSGLFLGLVLAAAGVYLHVDAIALLGAVIATCGLGLAAIGLFVASGGGFAGTVQTGVQLFDAVVRIGSNLVSFARLAAFGLTHAALGQIVWRGTTALAHRGPGALVGAVLLFVVGNAVAFALEALVAGVQALRLEFYELFSRVFQAQGRPFRPWHVPVRHTEVSP